jgi:hypothetical protein
VARQLDKIFTPPADSGDGEPVVSGDDVARQLEQLFPAEAETASGSDSTFQPRMAGLDERTIALPAMKAEDPVAEIASQSVADATVDADVGSAGESVVETEDLRPIRETGAYESGPPTTGDAVVGDDISERLDELFGEEESSGTRLAASPDEPGTSETATIELAGAATMAMERKPADPDVSGDDVKDRLTQIFGSEADADVSKTQGMTQSQVFDGDSGEPASATTSAPMLEMEEESDAGESETAFEPPNVATVTLAEIYFQQGLKEQALQIYRQLLEREPDNETARKRIEEIEASRSGDEAKEGSDADRRSPRPGLKVPRRKK